MEAMDRQKSERKTYHTLIRRHKKGYPLTVTITDHRAKQRCQTKNFESGRMDKKKRHRQFKKLDSLQKIIETFAGLKS
ncbi:hypothetical protein HUJ05_001658 [Dendroctonus ponderosae]|nr:hypothetical protein HUJ05_001658 [Dendroctonus ponderosae]